MLPYIHEHYQRFATDPISHTGVGPIVPQMRYKSVLHFVCRLYRFLEQVASKALLYSTMEHMQLIYKLTTIRVSLTGPYVVLSMS